MQRIFTRRVFGKGMSGITVARSYAFCAKSKGKKAKKPTVCASCQHRIEVGWAFAFQSDRVVHWPDCVPGRSEHFWDKQ